MENFPITYSESIGRANGQELFLWTEVPRVFMEVPVAVIGVSGTVYGCTQVKEITPFAEAA